MPIYRSFKAIESGKEEDMASALQGWSLLALLNLAERGLGADVRRAKAFPHVKLALLLWLVYGGGEGGAAGLWK